jgi:hypothetical protein
MDSKEDDFVGTNLTWSTELENVIKTTGEQANGLAWIHKRAESYFSYRRNFIELPVIVLSSAVGFCSVGTSTVFAGHTDVAPLVLGCLSLLVSVLNTVNSYFSWSKRAEGHRIAAVHYARLFRFLHIELSLPRVERMSPADVLKMVRESIDRLAETSPLLPKAVILDYRRKFAKRYPDVAHPAEINGLMSIVVVRDAIHVPTPRASSAFQVSNRLANQVSENKPNLAPIRQLSKRAGRSRSASFTTAGGDEMRTPPASPVQVV